MKKDQKDNLKKLPSNELQKKLIELEKEKMRLELGLRHKGFVSKRQAYIQGFKGNLKRIRKDIARVKTFLNIKLR